MDPFEPPDVLCVFEFEVEEEDADDVDAPLLVSLWLSVTSSTKTIFFLLI